MADRFAVEPSMAQTVAQLADEFNDAGMAEIDAAEDLLAAGDIEEGLAALQRLTVLRKLEVAKVANRRVSEVRRDPAARAAMAESDAEALYAKAVDLLWSAPRAPDDQCPEGDMCEDCRRAAALAESGAADSPAVEEPGSAEGFENEIPAEVSAAWMLPAPKQIELFATLREVVERYPESQAALMATWTLESLETDPILVQSVERAEKEMAADRLLQMATNYLNNERLDSGRALLHRIIDEYPESKAALHAEDLLKTQVADAGDRLEQAR